MSKATVRATNQGHTILGLFAAAFPEEVFLSTRHQSEIGDGVSVGESGNSSSDPVIKAMEQLISDALSAVTSSDTPLFSPYLPPNSDESRANLNRNAQLLKELSVLRMVLLRPASVYRWLISYDGLMTAMSDKGAMQAIADALMEAWSQLHTEESKQSASTLSTLTTLVTLYTDTIVLYAHHVRAAADGQGLTPSKEVLTRMLTLAQEMGAATFPSVLRRCGVLLASFVTEYIALIPVAVLRECVVVAHGSRGNLAAELPILASIAHILSRPPPADGERERGDTSVYLQQALELACQSVVYDSDVALLFRLDDAGAMSSGSGSGSHCISIIENVSFLVGSTFEALWTGVSADVWRYFTADALASAAKGMCMYAYAWRSIPHSVRGLLSSVCVNLGYQGRSGCAGEKVGVLWVGSSKQGPTIMDGAAATRSHVDTASRVACDGGPDVDVLLSSALGAGESPEIVDRGVALSTVSSYAVFAGDSAEPQSGEAECDRDKGSSCVLTFAAPRDRSLFFLSLYSFISAACSYHCANAPEMEKLFLWEVVNVPEDAIGQAHWKARCPGRLYALPESSAQLLPMPVQYVAAGEGGCVMSMLAQCMDLLWAAVRAPDIHRVLLGPSTGAECRFIEGSTALLVSLLLQFPHELSSVHTMACSNVLDLCRTVTTTFFSAPPLACSPMLSGLIYTLVERYHSAFATLHVPASRLVAKGLIDLVGQNNGAAETATSQLRLYAYLLHQDSGSDGIPALRLLSVLCDLRPGVISSTREGAAFFVHVMCTLCTVLDSEAQVTLRGMLGESAIPLQTLVSRVGEGVWVTFYEHALGNLFLCGSPVRTLLGTALVLLTEVLTITSQYAALPDCLVPVPTEDTRATGRAVAASQVLLSVLAAQELPYEVYYAAGEVLGATLVWVRGNECFFRTLRSNMSLEAREVLCVGLHETLRSSVGQRHNVVRLVVLQALCARDPSTFEYLTGPNSMPQNKNAAEMADLELSKALREIVQSRGGALSSATTSAKATAAPLEKAAALRLLKCMGATDAVSTSAAMELLAALGAGPLIESVELAAAVTAHVNTFIASAAAKEQRGSSGSGSVPPQRSTSTPGSSAGTPRLSVRKAMTGLSDVVDKLLRGGAEYLGRARDEYANLYENLYYDDCSLVVGASHRGCGDFQTSASSLACGLPREYSRSADVVQTALAQSLRQDHGSLTRSMTMLSRQFTLSAWEHAPSPAALNTTTTGSDACSGSRRSPYHTDALPSLTEAEEERCCRPFPMVLGPHYCFVDTENDTRLNLMASVLDVAGQLCAALEATVWLSGRDVDGGGALFAKRSLSLLDYAVQCTLIGRPSAPLLTRPLHVYVQRCLGLAQALAYTVEICNNVSGGGSGVVLELEVSPSLGDSLSHLAVFMQKSSANLQTVNQILSIFRPFTASALAPYMVWESLFASLPATLLDHVQDPASSGAVAALIANCSAVFAQCSGVVATACPLPALVSLMPLLARRAVILSHAVVAVGPTDDHTRYFVGTLRCLRAILLHCRNAGGLCFLPSSDLMALAVTLGQFRFSGLYDAASQCHRPQAWHSAWMAMLDLLYGILVTGGTTGAYTARSTGWLVAIATSVCTTPRFLLALGGFAEIPEADRSYYYWDVKEMHRCTQLAAIMACLGCDSQSVLLLPRVQQSFQLIHRFRLLRLCIASNRRPETAAVEGRAIEAAQVRTVRDQLTFLLQQPVRVVPITSGMVPSLAFPLPTRGGDSDSAGTDVPSPSGDDQSEQLTRRVARTLDLLRHFIVQELNIIRRASSSAALTPDILTPQSRGSSAPRSPSHSRTDGDIADSVMDEITTAPDFAMELQAEYRSLHVDSVQLALTLFILGVEEVVNRQSEASGRFHASAFQRELRTTTDKLLHTLDGLRNNMRSMDSPKLTSTVALMRHRLQAIVSALQS